MSNPFESKASQTEVNREATYHRHTIGHSGEDDGRDEHENKDGPISHQVRSHMHSTVRIVTETDQSVLRPASPADWIMGLSGTLVGTGSTLLAVMVCTEEEDT